MNKVCKIKVQHMPDEYKKEGGFLFTYDVQSKNGGTSGPARTREEVITHVQAAIAAWRDSPKPTMANTTYETDTDILKGELFGIPQMF